jgi:adenylate cyclase
MTPLQQVWLARAGIALLAALIFFAARQAPPGIGVFDEMLRDPLVRMAKSDLPEERIVIVDIDEASLAEFGPWPWPRGRLADLVEILLGPLGASAVALDMVFPEPKDPAGDARLSALAAHAPLTLSVAMDYQPRRQPLTLGAANQNRRWRGDAPYVAATGYVGNHPGFSSAKCVGNIGFVPDADGAIRRLPALSRFEDWAVTPLAHALLECAGRNPPDLGRLADRDGFWRIPYRRDWSAYTVVSAGLILAEQVPTELFSGKLVLVGFSSLGLSDRVATPLSVSTSGVMVHAASLSAMLDLPPHRPAKADFPVAALWLTASLSIWFLALPRLGPGGGVALLAGYSLGWLGVAYWLIEISLPLLPMLLAYATLLVVGIPFEWWQTRRNSARVLNIFSHYVAPAVLTELLRQPNARPLTPDSREISVLVADMEGYTKHVAALPLASAARLTTDFLDCLTEPILATGGTLDRYTGDGLVAFWGAPIPCNDHPARALSAALRIQSAVAEFNRTRAARGLPPLRVRIGIESGFAVVGDLGTPFRSTYTAVGECINLAAKLEQAARFLPTDIVIGPGMRVRLGDSGLRPLGRLTLGGLSVDCWAPADSTQGDQRSDETMRSSSSG